MDDSQLIVAGEAVALAGTKPFLVLLNRNVFHAWTHLHLRCQSRGPLLKDGKCEVKEVSQNFFIYLVIYIFTLKGGSSEA